MSPSLEHGRGRSGGELGAQAGGVPILPGFDEAAVFDADDGDAGYLGLFAGGLVSTGNCPAQADHVVFGQGGARLDVNIVELSADAIVEVGEFLWAADGSMTFVEDTVLVEQLKNGVATGLIPDFVKPAQGESLVVF